MQLKLNFQLQSIKLKVLIKKSKLLFRFSSGTELRDSDSKLFSAIYDFQGQGDDELTFQVTYFLIISWSKFFEFIWKKLLKMLMGPAITQLEKISINIAVFQLRRIFYL